jgi:hypothetical protein
MTDTNLNTGAASLSDERERAAITACALMIKGICLTRPNAEWTGAIEDRIQFMLKQMQAGAAIAAGGAQEAVQVGSETWDVLRLCITELSSWMHDHGQDLRSQEAIKRARALLAASTSANVAQGAEAVVTVKVYETYTGQNGWIEVTQEEYDRTKDKYEHRIRRVPAPPAQTALTDDARDAERYRWLRDWYLRADRHCSASRRCAAGGVASQGNENPA